MKHKQANKRTRETQTSEHVKEQLMETIKKFCDRVAEATGKRIEHIRDGVEEDLLGGHIVARRGSTTVVYVDYAGQDAEGYDTYNDVVVVNRDLSLPQFRGTVRRNPVESSDDKGPRIPIGKPVKKTIDDIGNVHSINGQPALVYSDGTKYWFKHGQVHRAGDKPAVLHANGTKVWCRDGRYHRDGDLPAVTGVTHKGKEFFSWWKDGNLHREGDRPAVIEDNGDQSWYKKGKLHREGDKPAVIARSREEWRKRGKLHRDGDLPAVIYANGEVEYWKNDKRVK